LKTSEKDAEENEKAKKTLTRGKGETHGERTDILGKF